ncbi:cytochrome c oxidase subunit II [Caldivirga maquilingensis]|uniref:Cytochrome c oxidase subunit II n=1 Tax=Caldivirga maquilingensis (strain ATCC 700844 / DSM 13496 / JCM 10307 / IC-167) TaxID=397948 RepID=A8MBM0_CALMQ|nr:cytochrome c oxidase subunit II [Caldivirga maquilingensis]ABW02753.1 cytochrome c oxidase subunit II [Caldivirga maquilingensis IC-167]
MTIPTYAGNVGLGPDTIAGIFIAALLVSLFFIVWVARNAKRNMSDEEYAAYRHRIERLEKIWVVLVIVALIIPNVITFQYTPQVVTGNTLAGLGVNMSALKTACPTVPPGNYQNACTSTLQSDIQQLLPLQNEGKIMIVVVIAGQWYWHFYTVAPNGSLVFTSNLTVPAGKPVVFLMTSVDVNHDFGAYDENGNLLFQYQVSPDYVSVFTYVFNIPEPIIVRCLEYCGPGHWAMVSQFTVNVV